MIQCYVGTSLRLSIFQDFIGHFTGLRATKTVLRKGVSLVISFGRGIRITKIEVNEVATTGK